MVYCRAKQCHFPGADRLFAADELRPNYIYGICVETIRALAARQLCRFGAQGGMAELRGVGDHTAGVLYLRV